MTTTTSKQALKAKPHSKATTAKPEPRIGTKTHILITLLERPDGATADELMKATGWQKHSVLGFIAGTVKKKMGFSVSSEKPDDSPRRYRILGKGE